MVQCVKHTHCSKIFYHSANISQEILTLSVTFSQEMSSPLENLITHGIIEGSDSPFKQLSHSLPGTSDYQESMDQELDNLPGETNKAFLQRLVGQTLVQRPSDLLDLLLHPAEKTLA